MKSNAETGAMSLPTTRLAFRRYSWRLIARAILCVLALNVLDSVLLRIELPEVVTVVIASLILVLAFCVLGAVLSYARLLFMRTMLRRTDWNVVSGCSRAVFVGPLPVAQVAVVDFGGDDPLAVDYVGPLYFSRRLPGDVLPANLLVARWRGLRVYSALDGSTPTFGIRVRPKFLRSLVLNVVPHI
jgi:hypothetical protein